MLHLQDITGNITTDPGQMKKIAVDIYTELYSVCECNSSYVEELLNDLPEIWKQI